EGDGRAEAAAHAAGTETARLNRDDVLPKRGHLRLDARLGAIAHADDGNDGPDADDDAERREDRAHGVAAESTERDAEDGGESHFGCGLFCSSISYGK